MKGKSETEKKMCGAAESKVYAPSSLLRPLDSLAYTRRIRGDVTCVYVKVISGGCCYTAYLHVPCASVWGTGVLLLPMRLEGAAAGMCLP